MLIKAPASALPLELKKWVYVNKYGVWHRVNSLRSCPSILEVTVGMLNTSPATKYYPASDNYKQQNEHLEQREDVGDPQGGAVMRDHD